MKRIILLTALFGVSYCYSQSGSSLNKLSKKEMKDGWKLLFDGKTTSGWHTYNKPATGEAWKVSDGALFFDTSSKVNGKVTGGGDLITDKTFSNFHLKYEWKISQKGNSGVMIYVQEDPKYGSPYFTGPEIQILDNDGHSDGKITKHRAGDLYDLIKSTKETVKAVGEWNQVEIIADKGNLSLFLNGEMVVKTTMWDDNWKQMVAGSKFKAWKDFGTFQSGKIDLQDHGNAVWFRNIKIKEL